MGSTTTTDEIESDNRLQELKAFDETKVGVKGLVDKGILKIPTLFHNPPRNFSKATNSTNTKHTIPVIDFTNIGKDPNARQEIISKVREASEKWGFFQVVNHGIPLNVLQDMKEGVLRFHEQDTEVKKEMYIILEYGRHVMKLGMELLELLSEIFGLDPHHLKNMDCYKGNVLLGHYYPPCPEPELTMGAAAHCDPNILTVLLLDHIGGLQILHQDKWIDVPLIPESLVINIGDVMQVA
ncbi:hypothetical protein TSUD_56060 [Trifolium subterraneum]|uniref:Fe2OG dioxygenase domain-containing protein n=1 Tax=Trifolium subterraneum TaxID=3900 RepID=A0A2Z6M517_TRISU|nr:hypothetical protein TSUD_56060 [Trifolium subterraneum]